MAARCCTTFSYLCKGHWGGGRRTDRITAVPVQVACIFFFTPSTTQYDVPIRYMVNTWYIKNNEQCFIIASPARSHMRAVVTVTYCAMISYIVQYDAVRFVLERTWPCPRCAILDYFLHHYLGISPLYYDIVLCLGVLSILLMDAFVAM